MDDFNLTDEQIDKLPISQKLSYLIKQNRRMQPLMELGDDYGSGKKLAIGVVVVISFLTTVGGALLWIAGHIRFH